MHDILRFTTVGSVDDGKSTLIGRLLFDSKSIFEDQLAAVRKTSEKKGFTGIDLSLLTDGLSAEREQGITIDVAYRYFSTPKRKFIIADTPGHEQYTRNMVTGASTANLTIILLDARKGILDQSRRHALISSLLGIEYFIVAVNKMDLVDFSQAVFDEIVGDFLELTEKLNLNREKIFFVPISALYGHNVVDKSGTIANGELNWYQGPTILEILESVSIQQDLNTKPFRLPVQYVIREDGDKFKDFRGFAGQVSSGMIRVGEEVISLPSTKKSKVKSIVLYEDQLDQALAKESITLVLEDEIDTSRGDLICKVNEEPQLTKQFNANLCWMSESKFKLSGKYTLKQTSLKTKAITVGINYKLDINSYEQQASTELQLNDIANISLKLMKPIAADLYKDNRNTGSFILIDETTNNTVAAGMITEFL